MDKLPFGSNDFSTLEAQLPTLPPFKAQRLAKYLKEGRLELALALLQPGELESDTPLKPPAQPSQRPQESTPDHNTTPSTSPPSAGLLLAQAEQTRLEPPHPLECPSDDDPRWLECKRRAVARIKLKSGSRLPFKVYSPKHGERSGPGAFVALLLALMLYYRDCQAVLRFPIFAVQWALADVLSVSPDTVQRWQKSPEVCRWVQSWRWLDAEADYHRAGMLYTVLWNPEHRHKKPQGDLLKLKLRSLREDTARGATRKGAHAEECEGELERLHKGVSLKARWRYLIPLNKEALAQFGELKNLVGYVAALNPNPARSERMRWAEELVAALERHLGLGDDPGTRRKLYWKIALTCLRALVYGNPDSATTPILMLKRALSSSMVAQAKFELYNPGGYFCKRLRNDGFFELAGFYGERRVT